MPFVPYNLSPVVTALRKVAAPRLLLCLSCPDLIMSRKELGELIPEASSLPAREDSEGILRWHKSTQFREDGVVDTWDAFHAMQTAMVAFDVTAGRGREVINDLNEGIPSVFNNTAHVVFDCISNQVARPANAVMAAIQTLKAGGVYVACLPATMVNQGYFNMCPSFFFDLLAENGFEDISVDLIEGVYSERSRIKAEPAKRMRNVPEDAMLLVQATRAYLGPPKFPMLMTKFHGVRDCKIHGTNPLFKGSINEPDSTD